MEVVIQVKNDNGKVINVQTLKIDNQNGTVIHSEKEALTQNMKKAVCNEETTVSKAIDKTVSRATSKTVTPQKNEQVQPKIIKPQMIEILYILGESRETNTVLCVNQNMRKVILAKNKLSQDCLEGKRIVRNAFINDKKEIIVKDISEPEDRVIHGMIRVMSNLLNDSTSRYGLNSYFFISRQTPETQVGALKEIETILNHNNRFLKNQYLINAYRSLTCNKTVMSQIRYWQNGNPLPVECQRYLNDMNYCLKLMVFNTQSRRELA